jgi:hypothetical protein
MTSAQGQLQNLRKIGKLKAELPNQVEFDGLVMSAKRKLPTHRRKHVFEPARLYVENEVFALLRHARKISYALRSLLAPIQALAFAGSRGAPSTR